MKPFVRPPDRPIQHLGFFGGNISGGQKKAAPSGAASTTCGGCHGLARTPGREPVGRMAPAFGAGVRLRARPIEVGVLGAFGDWLVTWRVGELVGGFGFSGHDAHSGIDAR